MKSPELVIFILAAVAFILIGYGFFKKSKQKTSQPTQENYILGLKAQLEGLNDEAYEYFRKTVSDDTGNVDAYLRLGNLLREKGSIDRAFQVHRELSLRSNLTDWEKEDIQEAMVEDLLALDRFTEAGKILRQLYLNDKNNIKLLEKLLEIYTRAEDWVNVIPTAEELSKLDRERYDGHFLSMYKLLEGKTYAVAEDNHNARIAYKEALNFDENCARAYLYIGDAYSVDGRLEDAIDWWKKLCEELSQKSYICYSRLESALFELGRFSAIAEIYLRILEKDEKNIRAIRSLARIQVKMGKIPEAINHLNDVLKIKPDDNAAAMELFNLYKQNNNVEGMMEVAENFCNIDYREEDLFTCSNCSHVLPEPEIICPKCRKVGTYAI